jgi:hypothetical protein
MTQRDESLRAGARAEPDDEDGRVDVEEADETEEDPEPLPELWPQTITLAKPIQAGRKGTPRTELVFPEPTAAIVWDLKVRQLPDGSQQIVLGEQIEIAAKWSGISTIEAKALGVPDLVKIMALVGRVLGPLG